MTDTLSNFIDALKHSQDARKRSAAGARVIPIKTTQAQYPDAPAAVSGLTVVEYRSDPNHPGFHSVTIYGATDEIVQREMTRAMNAVERDGGLANFKGPRRVFGGFGAIGEIFDTGYGGVDQ